MTKFLQAAGALKVDEGISLRRPLSVLACLMLVSAVLTLLGEYVMQTEVSRFSLAVFLVLASAYALFLSRSFRPETKGTESGQDLRRLPDAFDNTCKKGEGEKTRSDFVLPANKPESLEYTDKATGLGNELRMKEKFKTLQARYNSAENGKVTAFSVGLVNLDGMKPINDLFGRDGGDRLIEQCSMRLQAAVEPFGFVFRCKGDEFAFILPGIDNSEELAATAKLLQEVLVAPFDIDGTPVRLSGSFGFAVYPQAGDTLEKMTGSIETALYHSKHQGRGRLTIYSPEIDKMVRENAILEQALRKAISDDNIAPHYQPIISLQDGKLLGFEALARWIDPDMGFVSPAKFIPLAEERGIITQLTEVLLLKSARAAAEWPDDLFLSFNLSSVQLVDPGTAQVILDTIKRAGLPPRRLEIEVTETAMMSDPETATMIIAQLHDAGIRISMDDFGTGQSSLGRLRELKLDKVKIDRAFIMAIGEDKPAEHIVRAILEMCVGLDLKVVAEGIEEIDQAESLKKFGCDAGQGYLFGKPQDANRTMRYIREFDRIAKSDRAAKVA